MRLTIPEREIMEWARERVMRPDGGFTRDALQAVLAAMENCPPSHWLSLYEINLKPIELGVATLTGAAEESLEEWHKIWRQTWYADDLHKKEYLDSDECRICWGRSSREARRDFDSATAALKYLTLVGVALLVLKALPEDERAEQETLLKNLVSEDFAQAKTLASVVCNTVRIVTTTPPG